MSTTEDSNQDSSPVAGADGVDMKLEVVPIPAADVAGQPPGSIGSSEIRFGSASDLAAALRRARAAHGARERRMFEDASSPDVSWPDWYAAYIAAEQAGAELPQ
jgi:hypothetical protein